MKYIHYFEDDEFLENFKDDIDKIHESDKWLIIRPKSFKAFQYYSKDQDWSNASHEYYFNKDTYLNIDKETNDIIVLDFYRDEFYTKDDDTIYIDEFLEKSDLFSVYVDIIPCGSVVKKDGSYWLVIDDDAWFADFFDTDRRDISEKFIKGVLSGDGFQFFYYESDHFEMREYGLALKDQSFNILKIMLILKKIYDEELDYDLDDIEDYSDACSVINEYDLEDIEKFLKNMVARSHEYSDQDAAYDELLDAAYDFFNLKDKSAKWDYYKNSKNQMLWIEFQSVYDACKTKLILNDYDIEYDKKIDYSPPYYGYSGDSDVTDDYFNQEFIERYSDEEFDNFGYDEISECDKNWKKLKEEFPNYTDDQLFKEYKIFVDSSKYNL